MTLLARHAPGDVVAFGPEGDRTTADLRRDAGRIAAALRARGGASARAERSSSAGGAEARSRVDRATRHHVLAPSALERGPGFVVVVADDRYHLAASVLGAWSAGLVVLLPPSAQTAAIERLADGALALLHDGAGPAEPGLAPERLLDVRAVIASDIAPETTVDELEADRVLAVVHTSGSTGEPLPVRKCTSQLLGEATALVRALRLDRPRVAATAPGHHLYGLLFGVLVPLSSGGALLRRPPLHAEALAAALRAHGVDVLASVPAHLRGLEPLAPGGLPPLARVFSSGAPLAASTARALVARDLEVTEVLGSTETGGIAWRTAGGDGAWRPLPGVRVDFAGDGGMLVDSPWLEPGAPRPVSTADAGEPLADGRFRHHGRRDGIVKVGGARASLAEVERLLLALPGVRDAAAIAVASEARGQEVVVAAVVEPGLDVAALRAALARHLEPVVVPRRVHLLASLPRELTGKLPRARLLEALGLHDAP